MKKALEKTPKHDFVLPAGEVHRVRLCGTGKTEVFLAGTEPQRTCGNEDETPSPRARDRSAIAPPLPVAKGAAPKVPPAVVPLTPPPNTVGDGQHQVPLAPEPTNPP
jgi:hypothetical protein